MRFAHEAERNPVHLMVDGEFDVLDVLFREGGNVQRGVGQIHPLVAVQDARQDHPRANLRLARFDHFQLQHAVVE